MNLVEAIDAWIDDCIDDLTDADLELVLEIHDAVSASEFVDLETSLVYDEDIEDLVELTGGNADDRYYTGLVLRSAFYEEEMPSTFDWPSGAEVTSDWTSDDEPTPEVSPSAAELETSESDAERVELAATDTAVDELTGPEPDDEPDEPAEPELAEPDDDEPDEHDEPELAETDDDEPELDEPGLAEPDEADPDETDDDEPELDEPDEPELAEPELGDEGNASFLADLADARTTDGFLADLATASAVDQAPELVTPTARPAARLVAPVELREGDALGPSFLPPAAPAKPAGRPWRQWLVSGVIILGLSVFVFGTFQLLGSLSEEPEETATTEVATTPEPAETGPTPFPSATPAPTAGPVTTDADAPAAAAPDDAPLPRIGIRLVTGDVVLATFGQPGEAPVFQRIYNVSNSEIEPAADISWTNGLIGVVDVSGDVLLIDPEKPGADPVRIYEAGEEVDAAAQISTLPTQLAIRTAPGDIVLIPDGGIDGPDDLEVVWDAELEEAAAIGMTSVGELVPFVLDSGDAQMIVTSEDNDLIQIWNSEDQPPAFNLDASPTGILLGVGQGAVARYEFGDIDNPLGSVWDPIDEDDTPAIAYSSTNDERVAVVLGDGTLLITEGELRTMLWNPVDTEIRALSAVGDERQLVVLLETGSVLRIPLDGTPIESLWDITDETLSAANEIAIEPQPDSEG